MIIGPRFNPWREINWRWTENTQGCKPLFYDQIQLACGTKILVLNATHCVKIQATAMFGTRRDRLLSYSAEPITRRRIAAFSSVSANQHRYISASFFIPKLARAGLLTAKGAKPFCASCDADMKSRSPTGNALTRVGNSAKTTPRN